MAQDPYGSSVLDRAAVAFGAPPASILEGVQKFCQCGSLLLQRTGIIDQPQGTKLGSSKEPERLRPRGDASTAPSIELAEEQRVHFRQRKTEPHRLRLGGDDGEVHAAWEGVAGAPRISVALAEKLAQVAGIAERLQAEVSQKRQQEAQRARPLLAKAADKASMMLKDLDSQAQADVVKDLPEIPPAAAHRSGRQPPRRLHGPSIGGAETPPRTPQGSRLSPAGDPARKVAQQQAFRDTVAASPMSTPRSHGSSVSNMSFMGFESEPQVRRQWLTRDLEREETLSSVASSASSSHLRVNQASGANRLQQGKRSQRIGEPVRTELTPQMPGWLTQLAEERRKAEDQAAQRRRGW
mmetsp:Transcript_11725/g.21316  ORF Transcript_11725/g.21316 Transcript_11725/m.21316 type:complete len:353 (-) Transcript_11725:79-1137(-)